MTEQGLCESREKAKALIIAGEVLVDGNAVHIPSTLVRLDQKVEITQQAPYVSRGGYKLEKAIEAFNLDLKGLVCADLGASTGGFTDCMLQNGAESVYAVDVGYGQLAWKLRSDPRVHVMERTNVRYLQKLDEWVDLATIDVSFISLRMILPAAERIIRSDGRVVALIKPQFEAGKAKVGKKGVVRDPAVQEEVIRDVLDAARSYGFGVAGLTYSPIKGPSGNIEYLVHLALGEEDSVTNDEIAEVVRKSHEVLDKNEAASGGKDS